MKMFDYFRKKDYFDMLLIHWLLFICVYSIAHVKKVSDMISTLLNQILIGAYTVNCRRGMCLRASRRARNISTSHSRTSLDKIHLRMIFIIFANMPFAKSYFCTEGNSADMFKHQNIFSSICYFAFFLFLHLGQVQIYQPLNCRYCIFVLRNFSFK